MNLKKLTQAVFEGLPKEYRWAAVDADGRAYAKNSDEDQWTVPKGCIEIAGIFDTTDWQNSKIERLSDTCIDDMGFANAQKQSERQDVPTAADIGWSRQDVPAGATHYSLETDATHALFYKDDFTKMWVVVWPSLGWQDALPVSEHERIIEIPTKPEPQVDWSKAPEGATHWHKDQFIRWTGKRNPVFGSWDMDGWIGGAWALAHWGWQGTLETFLADGAVPRPPVHDVTRRYPVLEMARSIEAARVAEKSIPFPDGDPRYFETSDVVNNPAHYTTGGIECIDAMQAMLSRDEFIGYLRGNIFKYQWRYKHKNGVEDLRKADWYAQRLIKVEGEK